MNKNVIINAVIWLVLLLLIVGRAISLLDGEIVALVDYISMSIAIVSTLINFTDRLKKRFKPNMFFLTVVLSIIFIFVGFLIYAKVIQINDKAGDLITLVALIVSLPINFYNCFLDTLKVTDEKKRLYKKNHESNSDS